jgi:predicted HicB family RNase H-like nuclease
MAAGFERTPKQSTLGPAKRGCEAMNVMNSKGYQGRFEYDPGARIFHGEVLNLADVVTFQGRSIEESRQALADSVEDYLAFCAEKSRNP